MFVNGDLVGKLEKEPGTGGQWHYFSNWPDGPFINPGPWDSKSEATKSIEDDINSVSVIAKRKKVAGGDAYGGVLVENGKVLLREPSNHYGGYVWTFAKGRPDSGESPEEVALREVYEETGYNATIIEEIPQAFRGDTSDTYFYIMEPKGEPDEFGWETESIKWVGVEEARELVSMNETPTGKKRDLSVLDVVEGMGYL